MRSCITHRSITKLKRLMSPERIEINLPSTVFSVNITRRSPLKSKFAKLKTALFKGRNLWFLKNSVRIDPPTNVQRDSTVMDEGFDQEPRESVPKTITEISKFARNSSTHNKVSNNNEPRKRSNPSQIRRRARSETRASCQSRADLGSAQGRT